DEARGQIILLAPTGKCLHANARLGPMSLRRLVGGVGGRKPEGDLVCSRGNLVRDHHVIGQSAAKPERLAVGASGNEFSLVLDDGVPPVTVGGPGPAIGFQILNPELAS